MNSFYVVAVILVAAGVVHAATDFAEIKKIYTECAEITKATESYEQVIEKKIIPTSDNGMCLVKCMLEKKGIYHEDGKYNPEGAKAYLKKKYDDNEDKYNKAIKIVDECSKMDVKGLDQCEAAVKHASCVKATASKDNLDLKD